MLKKTISVLLIVLLIFALIPVCANASTNEDYSDFSGGKGTKNNPYLVSTPEQLNNVRNHLDCFFKQIADIDMTQFSNWQPIGCTGSSTGSTLINDLPETPNEPFIGTYDGNGYKIYNLTINDNKVSFTSDVYGLFGALGKSTVKNVHLVNIDYSIDKSSTDYVSLWKEYGASYGVYVGGLAGKSTGDTIITNCSSDGSINIINCNDAYVGGIIGFGNVTKCENSAKIYVKADASSRYVTDSTVCCGGIVGHPCAVYGKVRDCVNRGDINAIAGDFLYCGGISGEYGSIVRCTNQGNVAGQTISYNSYSSFAGNCNVGGIVGATSGEVFYSINYGNINSYAKKGASSYAAGIVGFNGFYGSGQLNTCFNIGKNVKSIKQKKENEEYIDCEGNANRIVAGIGTYRTDPIKNAFSYCDTLVNDQFANTDISESSKNGMSYTLEEIKTLSDTYYSSNENILSMNPENSSSNMVLYNNHYDFQIVFDDSLLIKKELEYDASKIIFSNIDTGEEVEISFSSIDVNDNTLSFSAYNLENASKYSITFDNTCLFVGNKIFWGLSDKSDWIVYTEGYESLTEIGEEEFIQKHLDYIGNADDNNTYHNNLNHFDLAEIAVESYGELEDTYRLWKIARGEIFENPYYTVLADMVLSEDSAQGQIDSFDVHLDTEWRSVAKDIIDLINSEVELTPTQESKIKKMFKKGDFTDKTTFQLVEDVLGNKVSKEKLNSVFSLYDKTNTFIDVLNKGTDIVKSVYDTMNYSAILKAYEDTSDEFKVVLMQMAYVCQTENPWLYTAIDKYLNVDYDTEMRNKIIEEVVDNGISIGKFLFKSSIENKVKTFIFNNMDLSKAGTAVATKIVAFIEGAKIGYSIGVGIDNLLFSTDDVTNSFVAVSATAKTAGYLKYVLETNEVTFRNNPTLKNAVLFCETFSMYKNIQLNTADKMIEYFSKNQCSLINRIFQSNNILYEHQIYNWQILKLNWQNTSCHKGYILTSKLKNVTVACPVDVTICTNTGEIALQITDNIVEKNNGDVVATVCNNIKYITLPDDSYSIKITATENGTMAYSVTDYNAFDNSSKTICFNSIPIIKGNEYTGNIISGRNYSKNDVNLFHNSDRVESVVSEFTNDELIKVNSIKLSTDFLSLETDESKNISATVGPSNASNKTITWYSENPAVAQVDEYGKVTGISSGSTNIFCISLEGNIEVVCEVTVENKHSIGDTNLDEIVSISDATTVQKYLVGLVILNNTQKDLADTNGDGTINISDATTIQKYLAALIDHFGQPTNVSLNPTTLSMNVGDTKMLAATITPNDAPKKDITWTSSDISIATVSNGTVTAISPGTVTITAKTYNGKAAKCTVTVKPIEPRSISLNKSTLTLNEGDTYQLSATVNPSNTTDKSVAWYSNNISVASVDSNGKVTAKSIGSATITAKTSNGKKSDCTITVKDKWEGYTKVYTSEDFNNIRNNLTGKFVLMNDIDLSSFANWIPIGSRYNPFKGSFEGQNHSIKISGLTDDGYGNYGLFAETQGFGEIKNLTVNGSVEINSNNDVYCGIFIACCSGTKLINCTNNVNLSINTEYSKSSSLSISIRAGGIIGSRSSYTDSQQISDCTNNGKITVKSKGGEHCSVEVGGIIGSANQGTGFNIVNCSNNGKIEAKALSYYYGVAAGGIVGTNFLDTINISNCSNNAMVSSVIENSLELSQCSAGGIIGSSWNNAAQIQNCESVDVEAKCEKGDAFTGTEIGYIGEFTKVFSY